MPDESLVIEFHSGEHGIASVCATQLVFVSRHAVDSYKEPTGLDHPLWNCMRQLSTDRQVHARSVRRCSHGGKDKKVGRAVLCTPSRLQSTRRRARSDAPYRAARLISSSDAGFSKADVSPSFSPRYAARTIRRITFAFRVFGMSSTKITSRGASALPRSRATVVFNSSARPESALASFFNTQKQTSASPFIESGMPTAAASLTCG